MTKHSARHRKDIPKPPRSTFLARIERALAERGVSLAFVWETEGPAGLMAVAKEAGAPLDRLDDSQMRLAVIAGEVGLLVGLALGAQGGLRFLHRSEVIH